MRIKKISLALGLLVLPSIIGLMSCSKKKEGYTVKVSVTDIGTARVFVDSLKGTGATYNIKDSLVSKLNANANGAKITSVKVTYIDEKGKKIEDKSGELNVNGKFEKTYRVRTGKTIIVTATAEGSPVADTMIAKEEWKKAADRWAALAWTALEIWDTDENTGYSIAEAVKALKEDASWYRVAKNLADEAWKRSEVPGKPAEVTLPTLNITIEKGGDIIVAQSIKASKSNVKDPKDLTKAGEKTKVSATITAVASK